MREMEEKVEEGRLASVPMIYLGEHSFILRSFLCGLSSLMGAKKL